MQRIRWALFQALFRTDGRALADELPKATAKRMTKGRTLLKEERCELDRTALRYQAVVDRGAEALTEYDRTIAYGGIRQESTEPAM